MNTRWVRFPRLVKPWLELAQAGGTALALIAALWWFNAQHFIEPNLKLEQTITQRRVDDHLILWAIDVHATNIGKVAVELGKDMGKIDVYALIPPGQEDKKLESIVLSERLLQPGESDQVALELVRLADSYKTIQVNSYYAVPQGRQFWMFSQPPHYWAVRSLADLDEKQAQSDHVSQGTKDSKR